MTRFIFFLGFMLVNLNIHSQEKRLALVIGNSAYEHGGTLRNPVNDAESMKNALVKLGFDVLDNYNLGQADMKKAIDYFGMKLKDYDVGLFFYAGHGIQANGYNYLIPVDTYLSSEQQVEYDCVQADRVLALMEASKAKVKIVILDACRNNPFERSWTRTSNGRGLAFMNAPTGSLITYATSPGNTASDGNNNNGLYTEAILESMNIPGINILEMFQSVRALVIQRSNNRQTPWESTSLIGNFYFGDLDIDSNNRKSDDLSSFPNEKNLTSDKVDTASTGNLVDPRDGKVYAWARFGNHIWMTENLQYDSPNGSLCYDYEALNCVNYGRLYNWEVALQSCPEGWHLPSNNEWSQLESYHDYSTGFTNIGWKGTEIAHSLKSKTGWVENGNGINKFGFCALPGGKYEKRFSDIGKMAFFWSSTETDSGKAYFRHISSDENRIYSNSWKKQNYYSIRCVKD